LFLAAGVRLIENGASARNELDWDFFDDERHQWTARVMPRKNLRDVASRLVTSD
jgi:hypothetical protein